MELNEKMCPHCKQPTLRLGIQYEAIPSDPHAGAIEEWRCAHCCYVEYLPWVREVK